MFRIASFCCMLAVALVLAEIGRAPAPKEIALEKLTKDREATLKDLLAIGREASTVAAKTKAHEELVARFERRYREARRIDARLAQPQPAPAMTMPLATLNQRLVNQRRAKRKFATSSG